MLGSNHGFSNNIRDSPPRGRETQAVKVFVTGGTGLIGRHLIQDLIRRKDAVVCVSRSETRARSLLPVGVEVIEADPVQAGPWQERLAGCDAAVNLAGASVAKGQWSDRRKRVLRRSRLETTRNLTAAIEQAVRLGVPKVFALTLEPDFFEKLGFEKVEKETLPMKVWSDCAKCPKQENCDEIAVVKTVLRDA